MEVFLHDPAAQRFEVGVGQELLAEPCDRHASHQVNRQMAKHDSIQRSRPMILVFCFLFFVLLVCVCV